MNKILKQVADYSKSRISLDEVSLDTYVTTDNLLQNKLGKVAATKMPKQSSNSITRFDKGDILVANIRPYLKKIWFAKYTGGSSADVLTFKVKDGFDKSFIYYAIYRDDFFAHMMNGSKGTKMPRGDKNRIMDFPIPEFDNSIQKQIAKVLSDLDAKIEVNNKINQELEAMAKTLYDYWFVQFDFPDANGKPYKSSGGLMVFNKVLKREIPIGWDCNLLGDLGNFKNGVNYDPSNPGDIACPIINVRNISKSRYFLKNEDLDTIYLRENDVRKYAVHENSIIIARSGIPGATRLIADFEINTLYCGFAIHYQLENFDLKSTVFFYLKSIEEIIKSGSGGTILKNVNQATLNNLKIALPNSKKVIQSFNEKINPIFSKINLIQKENQKLSELRDWLLPMLMNGQVTVGEAEYEWGMVAEEKSSYGE